MTLKLAYDFSSDPNPIRASATGGNANQTSIHALISNPQTDPVPITKLTIEFPVGENSARALSSAASLPAPTYDRDHLPWDIGSDGGVVTITPKPGADGKLGSSGAILFRLDGVTVDGVAGVVPITVSEFRPQAPKAIDDAAYRLVKQPADMPVTRFWSEPAELFDVDQPVTLKWETNDHGNEFSYSVHSDEWQPKHGLDGGECFSWRDGIGGVATNRLAQTTTFALDVIQADAKGHLTIRWTIYTKARLTVPSISESSHYTLYAGGRLAMLHWMARNASRCSVKLDGVIIDDKAPVDAYQKGYPVFLSETSNHRLSVIANQSSEDAPASHPFDEIAVAHPQMIPLGGQANCLAASPDRTIALATLNGGVVAVVDVLAGAKIASLTLPKATGEIGRCKSVSITPDGKTALVSHGDTICFIDLATRSLHPEGIVVSGHDLGGRPWFRNIAITPDGKRAFVPGDQGISVIDIPGRRLVGDVFPAIRAGCISIVPNGECAFVGAMTMGEPLRIIDIARWQMVAMPLAKHEAVASFISFSPDSSLAFVSSAGHEMLFFDVPNRQWISLEEPFDGALSVAFSRDGNWGFANIQRSLDFQRSLTFQVAVIDVGARRVVPGAIQLPGPFGQYWPWLAVGRDRLILLTTFTEQNGAICLL